jgi:uncharacterized membrane protein YoaK (UPF0700 family)
LLALIGAVLLIGHDVVNAVVLLYPVAAFLFALGISVLAIRSWEANTLPHWTSALLITSMVVGILGFFVKGFDVLFIIIVMQFFADSRNHELSPLGNIGS